MDNQEDLDKLKENIDKFKRDKLIQKEFKVSTNKVNAFTIAIELVAGTIVGLITGVFFDRIFNTRPLFLIICLLLGILASVKTIWQKIK